METYQKVRIFNGAGEYSVASVLQDVINAWLEKKRPVITNTMQSITEDGQLVITIFYY